MDDARREEIRQYLEKLVKQPVKSERIKALDVNPLYHGMPRMHIEVGSQCANLEPDAPSQLVVAIFESRSFIVCTPDHGTGKGMPYFFTRDEVKKVVK